MKLQIDPRPKALIELIEEQVEDKPSSPSSAASQQSAESMKISRMKSRPSSGQPEPSTNMATVPHKLGAETPGLGLLTTIKKL